MKIKTIPILMSCIFFISCQSEESKMLSILEKAHSTLEYKRQYETTGAHGSYGILKNDELIKLLSHHDEMMQEIYEEKKRKIDHLVFNKIVEFTLLEDRTFINTNRIKVNIQKYSLSLTEKGKKLLLGETTDKFIFHIYDLGDFRLSGTPTIKDDTISINYTVNKIKKTEAFDCIGKEFLKDPNMSVLLSTQKNYNLTAKFLKTDSGLELIHF